MVVRTRFAPSPTGSPESIHLGFVIRALWNYVYAKKNGGEFVLRIEDTDTKRSRKDTEEAILATLKKFAISWDEGPDVGGPHAPYRQSERLPLYQEAAKKLVEKGYAYYDFDAQKRNKEEIKAFYETDESKGKTVTRPPARDVDPGESAKRVASGEPYVVRVKIPDDRKFVFDDWILKKKIEIAGSEVSDLILLKSDGYPTYHLAVVVDDIAMKISHVFRGQEWISTTPIHLYLYEGLESVVPEIGHFSVILDPRTGKKFSKRDMSAMFGVDSWLAKGYLPEALLNYLMLLGWAPKDNREFFTLEEFVQAFDQEGIQKANPTFDETKLNWFNQQWLQKLTKQQYVSAVSSASGYHELPNFNTIVAGTSAFMPSRMTTLNDFDQTAGFFFVPPRVDKNLLGKDYKKHLKVAFLALSTIEPFTLTLINERLLKAINDNNFKTGDFFMDLRVAVTGSKFTPPINESLEILGKAETLSRLTEVLNGK